MKKASSMAIYFGAGKPGFRARKGAIYLQGGETLWISKSAGKTKLGDWVKVVMA